MLAATEKMANTHEETNRVLVDMAKKVTEVTDLGNIINYRMFFECSSHDSKFGELLLTVYSFQTQEAIQRNRLTSPDNTKSASKLLKNG